MAKEDSSDKTSTFSIDTVNALGLKRENTSATQLLIKNPTKSINLPKPPRSEEGESGGEHQATRMTPSPHLAPELKLELPPGTQVLETGPVSVPKVKPAVRRQKHQGTPLVAWNTRSLILEKDPLGKGIALCMQKGANQALFLSIMAPPPGAVAPHFKATAAVAPEEQMALWNGFKWDPAIVPEMWNSFIRKGTVEAGPDASSIVRLAFGVSSTDWLTILRAGPANACRGAVALISSESILFALRDALHLIFSPLNKD